MAQKKSFSFENDTKVKTGCANFVKKNSQVCIVWKNMK